ncbi:hypothetical protein M0R04_14550 [Candidatus Dojkabacteria bacterium]|jgi:hypothetical protein|nr:hypothetical protein [Candidatus Dojkabacteria bacterium]
MGVYYNRGDGILEVIIRDDSGGKVEHFKMNLKDVQAQAKLFKILQSKYGIKMTPEDMKEDEGFFDF